MTQGTGASGWVRRGRRRVRSVALATVVAVVALAGCDGQLAHHAGTGVSGYSGDGGLATEARFGRLTDIVLIPGGGFYAVDSASCVIRKVPAGGSPVTTVAGTGVCGDDGDGPDAASRRINPTAPAYFATSQVALEPDGGLLFADIGNGVIRRVGTDGSLSTVAGETPADPADIGYCNAETTSPTGVAVAPDGTIYVTCFWDGLYRVAPGGDLLSVGTSAGFGAGGIEVGPDGRIWWVTVSFGSSGLTSNSLNRYDPVSGERDRSIGLPGLPTAMTVEAGGRRALVAYRGQVWQYGDNGGPRLVAGNGAPDPGGAVQSGAAVDGALSPTALAAGRYGVLIGSGSVVYHSVVTGMTRSCPDARAGADLRRAGLRGCDLSGRDLTGADLSGADLTGADLSGAVLAGATVSGPGSAAGTTWFESVRLTGADLTGVDLGAVGSASLVGVVSGGLVAPASLPSRWALTDSGHLVGAGTNLDGVGLAGEDLRGVDLAGASIEGTDLTGALLEGVASGGLRGVPLALPEGWSIVGGHLVGPGADLAGATLSDADLSGADLSGADLVDARLTGVDLSGADLSGVDLVDARLTGVDLSGTDLTGARVLRTRLTSVDLAGVDLRGIVFAPGGSYSVDLRTSDLTGADLGGLDLSTARLSGLRAPGLVGAPAALPANARMFGAHLVSAGANLAGLNVSGYDFRGLDLSSSNITGTNFTGANLDGLEMFLLVGNPSAFPGPGYKVVDPFIRRLIGPRMNLRNIDVSNLNLSGVDLSGANLDRATFTGATGTPVGGTTATYNLTRCPDGVQVSAPDTCVGRGFAP